MGRYGTREDEVDRLLREGVLVDLLRAVRQSLRASVESYSIKKMEAFYGFEREVDLRDAGLEHRRLRAVARARRGRAARGDILERIERYNRDDVVSNQRLRDWLEARATSCARLDGRPCPRHARRRAARAHRAQARVAGAGRAADGPTVIPTDPLERPRSSTPVAPRPAPRLASPRGQGDVVGVLPADGADPGALVDETSPIGLLEPSGPWTTSTERQADLAIPFPGAGLRPRPSAALFDPAGSRPTRTHAVRLGIGELVAVDPAAGRRHQAASPRPHPRAVVPLPWVRRATIRRA
jgi:hypothetical protein